MSDQTIELKITGMSCDHCKNFITRLLNDSKGVEDVQVNLGTGKALVRFNSGLTNAQNLLKAVNDSGIYSASIN